MFLRPAQLRLACLNLPSQSPCPLPPPASLNSIMKNHEFDLFKVFGGGGLGSSQSLLRIVVRYFLLALLLDRKHRRRLGSLLLTLGTWQIGWLACRARSRLGWSPTNLPSWFDRIGKLIMYDFRIGEKRWSYMGCSARVFPWSPLDLSHLIPMTASELGHNVRRSERLGRSLLSFPSMSLIVKSLRELDRDVLHDRGEGEETFMLFDVGRYPDTTMVTLQNDKTGDWECTRKVLTGAWMDSDFPSLG